MKYGQLVCTDLGAMFYVGLPVQQQADNLCSSLEAGQGQCCVAIGLYLSIDVWSHVKQQLHRRHMAVHGRQHKRRNAQFTASPKRIIVYIVAKEWDCVYIMSIRPF